MKGKAGFRALEIKRTKGLQLLTRAQCLTITTNEQCEKATDLLRRIKGEMKIVQEKLAPIVSSARKAWNEATSLRKETLAPYEDAESVLKDAIGRYTVAQRKAEEKLRAEQQEKAEAKANKDHQKAIEKAKQNGDTQLSRELTRAPVVVPTVSTPRLAPRATGVSIGERWDFNLVDPTRLPREFLQPDAVKIRQRVNQLGDQANIPGVQVFRRTTVAASV